MKPLFIWELNSVNTEKTERKENIQIPSSNIQRSSKFQAPSQKAANYPGQGRSQSNSRRLGFGAWNFSGGWMLDVGVFLCLPVLAFLFCNRLPPWVFMWVLAFAMYLACK